MQRIRTRIVATLTLWALLLALLPAAGASATFAYTHWGWVTVRNTGLGTYTPAAVDRGNSTSRANVVKQTSAGKYTIRFKGLGEDGGIPHVTVLGSSQRICLIGGWGRGSTATTEEVYVSCYNLLGTRMPTRFSVTYYATNGDGGTVAYLFASGFASEDANLQYSHNSSGGTNHIEHSGPGAYLVELPGLGAAAGHMQISVRDPSAATAGIEPAGVNPATCNVDNWIGSSGSQFVTVQCYERTGMPVDTAFNLTFIDHQGLKRHGQRDVAYLWAADSASSSYTPDAFYRYSKPAATPHITSSAVGRYTVTLPRMALGGAALVTAYGSTGHTCQLGKIRTGGSVQKVQVRCFLFDGSPADSQFTFSFLR